MNRARWTERQFAAYARAWLLPGHPPISRQVINVGDYEKLRCFVPPFERRSLWVYNARRSSECVDRTSRSRRMLGVLRCRGTFGQANPERTELSVGSIEKKFLYVICRGPDRNCGWIQMRLVQPFHFVQTDQSLRSGQMDRPDQNSFQPFQSFNHGEQSVQNVRCR